MQTPATPETPQPDLTIRTVVYGENPHAPGGISILLSVQPTVEAPNTRIAVGVPEGAIFMNGSQTWQGDLKAGQSIYLNLLLTIKSLSKADTLRFEAVFDLEDGSQVARTRTLYLHPVADGKIEFSDQPYSN